MTQFFQTSEISKATIATAAHLMQSSDRFSGNILICDIGSNVSVAVYQVKESQQITPVFSDLYKNQGSDSFDRHCTQLATFGNMDESLLAAFQSRRKAEADRINQDLLNHSQFAGLFHHKSLIVFGDGYAVTCGDAEVAFFAARQAIESAFVAASEWAIDRVLLTGDFANFFFCQQAIKGCLKQLELGETDLFCGRKESIGIRSEIFDRATLKKVHKDAPLLNDGMWTDEAVELFARTDIDRFGNETTIQLFVKDLCLQNF